MRAMLLLAGSLVCLCIAIAPASAAPVDDVRLRIEAGDGGYLAWADNRLAGPVEVILHGDTGAMLGEPALPARATVPARSSVLVSRLRMADYARGRTPGLRLDTVPGSVNASPREYEYLFPLQSRDLRVAQGWGGHHSHSDAEHRHAVDFATDIGTLVIAARGGVVMQLQAQAGMTAAAMHNSDANFVRILHDDGSMALYAHLQPDGVLVQPGQRVRRGQALARSGNSGNSAGPHLHFVVQVNRGMRLVSVPFRMFGAAGILRFGEP